MKYKIGFVGLGKLGLLVQKQLQKKDTRFADMILIEYRAML